MRNTWVCITAKNEAATIGDLVRALLYNYQLGGVVVVNDGSCDETGRLAERAGADVITHRDSAGIGPSLLEAWQYALNNGAGRIGQMDAGGSHDYKGLGALLQVEADVVIGSRFCKGGQYHGRHWRAWGSRAAALVMNLSQSGGVIRDWTSGYRVFTADAARRLLHYRYDARMHAWQIEVLARARMERLLIVEQPISYQAGDSSLHWRGVNEAVTTWLAVFNHMQVHG